MATVSVTFQHHCYQITLVEPQFFSISTKYILVALLCESESLTPHASLLYVTAISHITYIK